MTVSTATRLPFVRTEAAVRSLARMVARVLGPWLVLFCVVDDHLHVVVFCPEGKIGRLRTVLSLALRPLVEVPFDIPHTRRVRGRRHLEWLVEYLVTQTTHHTIAVHPARWSGSCFYDLVGARVLDGWEPRLFEQLPRHDVRSIALSAGIQPSRLVPAPNERVRAAGAAKLAGAAATALAVGPTLEGRSAVVIRARRAAAQLGSTVGLADDEMCWALGSTPRALRRIRRAAAEPRVLHAVRLQITLDSLELVPPRRAPRELRSWAR